MKHIWGCKKALREKRLKKGNLPFDKLTLHDKAIISMRKDFESGKAIELFLLWHSVLTAISFAFFIGLFSAGGVYYQSKILIVASVFFAVSLVMNGMFSIFYQLTKSTLDKNYVFKIHLNNKVEYLRLFALLSPFIATLLLVTFYSLWAMVVGAIMLLITSLIFYRAIGHDVMKLEAEINKQWRKALERDDLETLERIERRYG